MRIKNSKISKRSAVVLASLFGAMFAPQVALACGEDAYLGQICAVAGTYCPEGTFEADGRVLSVNEYPALYALIGITFGGNATQFNLPDLRGRSPVGSGTGVGLTGHAPGSYFGQESINQTDVQMAPHTHQATVTQVSTPTVTISATTTEGSLSTPEAGSYLAAVPDVAFEPVHLYSNQPGALVPLGGVSVQSSGSLNVAIAAAGQGSPMPILSPSLAMHYCMVTKGLWPPRP